MWYRFLLIIILFIACNKTEECKDPNLDCSNIRCIAFWSDLRFNLVDENNGNDLVFSTNPKYTISDIGLFRNQACTDTIKGLLVDNEKKLIHSMRAEKLMYLKIKNTVVYRLDAEFIMNDCCSERVKTIRLNNKLLCVCCDYSVALPIK